MHSLDYDMVGQVLQQFNYTGEVRANISPIPQIRGGGQVILMVHNGHILSCLILNKNGQQLAHGQEAYRLLTKLGTLDWDLIPFSTSPPPMTTALAVRRNQPPPTTHLRQRKRDSYPRHLPVSQAQTLTWSMLERSVYLLCDGAHSCEQIAILLSRSPSQIQRTIDDLQLSGVIELQ